MSRQRLKPNAFRLAAVALLLAVAMIRGTASTHAASAEPAVGQTASVDRGARQIVANHPIIPIPSAAGPAIVGLAIVARRAIRVATRGR